MTVEAKKASSGFGCFRPTHRIDYQAPTLTPDLILTPAIVDAAVDVVVAGDGGHAAGQGVEAAGAEWRELACSGRGEQNEPRRRYRTLGL